MRYSGFLKWFARVVFELFPYGLILALTFLSIGFFVYRPFSFAALSLSSASVVVSLVFVAYLFYGSKHEENLQ